MTRVAVVVGAHHAPGAACARRLLERGLDVALIGEDRGDGMHPGELLDGLPQTAGRCAVFPADPADSASFATALGRVRSTFGRTGVLVTCVGAGPDAASASGDAGPGATRAALRTLFVAGRTAAGDMVGGRWGRIVNVVAPVVTGEDAWREAQAVLAGVTAFTRSVALELAPFGITVNCVAPAALSPHERPSVGPAAPHGSGVPYPQAAADLTEHLVSDAAAAVTGQQGYVTGRLFAAAPRAPHATSDRGTGVGKR
ncbi:hypothetical protein DN069_28435 [Streptacidiphilus pinicola]|uniref:SDR family oxidoreductase n=1 Tax=Streptacidiphilus pinicola TaxID=2219663 RepID=A0A2X0IWW2_9ACTN|nr:SDR family NAD(P)-dependent oxidoreductase [Streptacidiphilus pinicola]RAG82246.1 hypothetical protein DN069_28435 [Streptacidiphilus pinicola]